MKLFTHLFARKAHIYWLLALLLSACSTLTELRQDLADRVFGREPPNPPAELEDIKARFNPRVLWSVQTGDTAKYDYTPALESDVVFMANAKGELTKLDAASGRQQWQINVGEPISGGVGAGGGLVIVGTSRGNVLAYDLSGKQVWKSKVSSEVLSVPRYFDGVVIVRAGNNHIFGIDAANGERKWTFERSSPALTLRSSAGLVVDGGAVYSGYPGGKLVAVRADNGKMIWEATVAQPKGVTEIERIADITSLPFVDGPIVYAVAFQGKVAGIDRRSGRVGWNRDISSYSGLYADLGRVFVSHTLGSVYALDYETGKTYWRQGALSNRRLSTPLPVGDTVAVGDLEGYVHFMDREDGHFVGRIKVDSDPVMSLMPSKASDQLLVATRGGGLYAVSLGAAIAANTSGDTGSTAPTRRDSTHSDVPWPVPKQSSEPVKSEQSTKDIEKTITETTEPIKSAPNSAEPSVAPGIQLDPQAMPGQDAPPESGTNTDSIMFKRPTEGEGK